MEHIKKRKVVKTYQKKRRIVQQYKEKRIVQTSVKRRTSVFNYQKEGHKKSGSIGRVIFNLTFLGALLGFFLWQRRQAQQKIIAKV